MMLLRCFFSVVFAAAGLSSHAQVTKTSYTDSLGNRTVTWFSVSKFTRETRKDSSKTFYPGGSLKSEMRFYYNTDTISHTPSKRKNDPEFVYLVITRNWSLNGRLIRETASAYNWSESREGECLEWDSTGNLRLDRFYHSGQVVEAKDFLYGKPDRHREELAHQFEGQAAIAAFPYARVCTGYGASSNFGLYQYPVWKDSLYLPQRTVDSLAWVIAGVYEAVPDTMPQLKTEMMSCASGFHPAKNEWIYTVLIEPLQDSTEWMWHCSEGIILSGFPEVDSYFRSLHFEILSASAEKNHSAGLFAGYKGNVVIRTTRPVNFLVPRSLLTKSGISVSIITGRTLQSATEFRYMKWNGEALKYRFYNTPSADDGMTNFFVLFKNCACTKQKELVLKFAVASDGSVDYCGLSSEEFVFPIIIE